MDSAPFFVHSIKGVKVLKIILLLEETDTFKAKKYAIGVEMLMR